ncbi:MAG: preprotein translocase subunit YajC [Lachnospiraceae bacterium]|jgi:preprotein translocase subunit YajC|nr:preprotein translocase subunit YajC [Lachnospiraceae bacterium]MCI8871818.1 preprotein translocase subunit YajC [Lachnospiraceae bacterium]MCI9060624.1 preprotein translocase subunit YajC [Lachnospiraceae bacterium]
MSILAQTEAAAGFSIVWILIMLVALYFMMIRPQQKETKRKNAMLAELAVGDTVLTTSGFYGMVIDITEDTVIMEFGNNKNCRIPMQKASIAMVEKPEDAVEKESK